MNPSQLHLDLAKARVDELRRAAANHRPNRRGEERGWLVAMKRRLKRRFGSTPDDEGPAQRTMLDSPSPSAHPASSHRPLPELSVVATNTNQDQ
jgi:hypothetical protein